VALVAEGVAWAQQYAAPQTEHPNMTRLKMKNPESYDRKAIMAFNQWWESVTLFLTFYPETGDQQKIAWVGTLLQDTAMVWHLNRYRELQGNDTWVNDSVVL